MNKKKLVLGAEITSGLQSIFLLSLLDKLGGSKKFKKIDLYVFNIGVFDQALIKIKKILNKTNYKFNYKDCRENLKRKELIKSRHYDYFVVRSRIYTDDHDRFYYTKKFFITTGNCNNVNIALKKLSYTNLLTLDDGLSNWRSKKNLFDVKSLLPKYHIDNFGKKKIASINKIFVKYDYKKYTLHFSIFSKKKELNLSFYFNKNIKKLSATYPKLNDIKYLYVGIWPASPLRISDTIKVHTNDDQIEKFMEIFKIKKIKSNTIYFKDHPKFRLNNISEGNIKFKRIKKIYNDAPLELIINSFKNLKEIYGFPSTGLFLIKKLNLKNVKINVIIRKNNPIYYSELQYLFKSNNFNLIFID